MQWCSARYQVTIVVNALQFLLDVSGELVQQRPAAFLCLSGSCQRPVRAVLILFFFQVVELLRIVTKTAKINKRAQRRAAVCVRVCAHTSNLCD